MISGEIYLWVLAIPMAYAIAWIVKKGAQAKNSAANSSVFFLLVMMGSMLAGALVYVSNKTVTSIVEAVVINMAVMTVGTLLVLKYWVGSKAEKDTSQECQESSDQELERSIIITRAYVVYFVVLVASMVSFAILYIVNHTTIGTEISLGTGMAIMTTGVLLILRYSMRHEFIRNEAETETHLSKSITLRMSAIFLVLLNEFLMGWVFTRASGIRGTSIDTNALTIFGNVVSSYWFIFIMVVEMAFTIAMFKKEIPRTLSAVFALQAGVMLFSAPAIQNETWITISIYISSGLMTILFIYLYQFVFKSKVVERATSRYIVRLIATYAIMLVGLFLFIEVRDTILFSVSIIAQMVLYFNAILSPMIFKVSRKKSYYRQSALQ